MTVDVGLLLVSGALASLAGVVVMLLSPSRLASLLSGVSLLLLGLEQLGWARAIDAIGWGERNYWLDLSFVSAPPVSLAWLLLSVTLGRGHGAERFRGWRVYVPVQALLSLATVAGLRWFSPVGRFVIEGSDRAVPLTPFGVCVLANLLLNVTLMAANFEATYLAFSNRWRRAFRPALLALLFGAASYGALIASSILFGRFSLLDVAVASVPVTIGSVILPFALLRRRVVDATVTGRVRSLYETAAFVLGLLLAASLVGVVQVMRTTGWSLARATWIFAICGVIGGLAAVSISSTLQRLLQRLLEPYLHQSHFDRGAVWSRLSQELDQAHTQEDLFRLIPAKTAEVAGVQPVTLFALDPARGDFAVVGSTILPSPSERVALDAPLARELWAAKRVIALRGRPDDLAYIPIYVENAKQIAACEAVCAVPLTQRDGLIGFLLCGDPEEGNEKLAGTMLLLEVVAQMVTARLTSLEGRG